MSQYNFVIMYQFDVQNVKTNVLIKRLNNQSFEEIKNRFEHLTKTLLIVDRLETQSIDFEKKNEKNSEKFIFVEKISRANKKNEICFKIRRRLKTSDSTLIENENLSNHFNCIIKNEFFYKADRLWIFDLDHLRLNVIRQVHDQIAIKHFDYVRTFRLINQCYYWSRMNKVIKRYVKNCHSYRRAKILKNKYNEKLNFLFILKKNWKNIILNFVVKFFRSFDRYNVILMIINRLSKKRHYIFCDIENDDITIEITVKMLIQHVWKLHELFLIIISNRDFQFVSIVWKTLCKIFDIVSKLSIAFHFETDDQFEIINQEMKRHFRTFCNHHQNNWFEILSMTKFVVNECHFAFIEIFSFMITKDFNSRMNFDVIDFSTNITRERILKRKAANITKKMNEIKKFVIENMKNA